MGLFDFLKKKELAEITELKSQFDKQKTKNEAEIFELKNQIKKYQSIINIESETEKRKTELELYIAQKKSELDSIIEKKNNEVKGLDCEISKLNTDYKQSLEIYTNVKLIINRRIKFF